ncbi:MAG: class I SAM-dependent methyltransferase [Gammaproteobacteria bacterium]|nr:class I SAM-dependent methyltransferase [Gammaproteobacteria bacterium]
MDIDEAAIVAARERYRDIANLEFRIGDAMAIEFADASFDIVLCCHVYEHVPDAARMMRETAACCGRVACAISPPETASPGASLTTGCRCCPYFHLGWPIFIFE